MKRGFPVAESYASNAQSQGNSTAHKSFSWRNLNGTETALLPEITSGAVTVHSLPTSIQGHAAEYQLPSERRTGLVSAGPPVLWEKELEIRRKVGQASPSTEVFRDDIDGLGGSVTLLNGQGYMASTGAFTRELSSCVVPAYLLRSAAIGEEHSTLAYLDEKGWPGTGTSAAGQAALLPSSLEGDPGAGFSALGGHPSLSCLDERVWPGTSISATGQEILRPPFSESFGADISSTEGHPASSFLDKRAWPGTTVLATYKGFATSSLLRDPGLGIPAVGEEQLTLSSLDEKAWPGTASWQTNKDC